MTVITISLEGNCREVEVNKPGSIVICMPVFVQEQSRDYYDLLYPLLRNNNQFECHSSDDAAAVAVAAVDVPRL